MQKSCLSDCELSGSGTVSSGRLKKLSFSTFKAELDKNWKVYLNRKYYLISRIDDVT